MGTNVNLHSGMGLPAEVVRHVQPPIDDLSPGHYKPEEESVRRDLAATFRLMDLFDWGQFMIHGHSSGRVSGSNHILLHPFGFGYGEITAASLIKLDLASGKILDQGSTKLGANPRAWILHSAVMKARPDINCVLHIHLPHIMAIAALDRPFIALHQETEIMGVVSIHEFCGALSDTQECDKIASDLGPINKVMILRNHGIAVCGSTVPEAFTFLMAAVYGLAAQSLILHVPLDQWHIPPKETGLRTMAAMRDGEDSGTHWGFGELDWQAWMRALDRMGLKTGYKSKLALWRKN